MTFKSGKLNDYIKNRKVREIFDEACGRVPAKIVIDFF